LFKVNVKIANLVKPNCVQVIKFLSFILLFSIIQGSFAQGTTTPQYRYLILFKDKQNTNYTISNPEAFLSQRAITRRQKMQIKINEQDLPVSQTYLTQLINQGVQILYPLKWVNGAVIKTDPSKLQKVLGLQSVKGYYKNMALDSISRIQSNLLNRNIGDESVTDYGASFAQLTQIGVDVMHQAGYKGENILISLLDDGFLDANTSPVLSPIFQEKRIKATIVTDPTLKNIYQGGSHGTEVLSTIAGQAPGKLYGTAYMANYALAQTEESQHELLIEEVNWLRGAEWADSLGTDIISSSLGYTTFDNPKYDHSYKEMDGKTAISSKAALWASQRGIICTISAGNEGASSWRYISSPADADSIISIGAVDRTGIRASFSSIGPTFDNRIKPEIAAMGLGTISAKSDGTIVAVSGTSFSAPLVAGLAAGLIQAHPTKSAWEIMKSIQMSGTLVSNPNVNLGYGIPNFDRASKIINPVLGIELKENSSIRIFPNPVSTGQNLHIKHQIKSPVTLEIISSQGVVLQSLSNLPQQSEISLPPFISGKYYFRFTSEAGTQTTPVLLNL
jgi:subtilisin family serine protease